MAQPPPPEAASPLPEPGIAVGDADDAELEPRKDAATERRESVVPAALHGQRLDKAVVAIAGEFSRNHLQGLIEEGHVSVDGVVAQFASRKVAAGQRLAVDLVPTQESRAFRAERLPLSVVYEDAHLAVVDKVAGMVVHPAAGNWSGTLLNGWLAHHAGAAALPRAGIVHRLDKDTSGLLVLGKTLVAMTALTRAIAAREVHREYLAIVHGEIGQRHFRVEAPLARDPQSRVRMAVVASGKAARTDVETIATAPGLSAVRCTLHTGRTHQIRVHLAARGHPLVADLLYGGRPALGLTRQALHAARLAFTHPVSGQALSLVAPLPADMASAWRNVTGVDA
jgi:23S rRNA pseudouridine1911/1915/1917 synthase